MTADQEKTNRLLLLGILVLAAALRFWWLKAVDTQPVTDFDWYFERAKNLATGFGYTVNGHHTAYWPPGYPLFLATFFKLFGTSVPLAKLLNIALSVLLVYQTHQVGRRLHPHPGLALVAAGLVAVLPQTVAYSTILASEPLFTALVLAATLASLTPEPKTRHWVAVGIWSSLATLVRPQAVLIPFILIGVKALSKQQKDFKPVIALGISLAALALVQLPWFARNARIFQSPVFVSTNGGDNLWIGHNPLSTGRYVSPSGRPAPPEQELANDRAQRQAALAYLKENPTRFFHNAGAKLSATFLESTDVSYWAFQTQKDKLIVPGSGDDKAFFKWTKTVSETAKTWFFALTIGALLVSLKLLPGRRALVLPTAMVAYTAFLAVAFFGNPRFGYPAIPFMALIVGTIAPVIIETRTPKPKTSPSEDSEGDAQEPVSIKET